MMLEPRRPVAVNPLLMLVLIGFLVLAPLWAGETRSERVQFAPGANSATIESTITGDGTVDFVLGARQGQAMNLSMASDNPFNYFNILPPGGTEAALFNGSTSGNQYEGTLPATGDYRVRVYLMGEAARRGETANYRLEMIIAGVESGSGTGEARQGPVPTIAPAAPEEGGPRNWEVSGVSHLLHLREQPSTGAKVVANYASGAILDNLGCLSAEGRVWCDVQQLGGGPRGYVAAEYLRPAISPNGAPAMGPDDSALRAGQGDFDASGQIPCAHYAGQPMTECDFGVARAGGGYATVIVTGPDGRRRAIFFRNGVAIGADTSEADGYGEFRAEKEADLNLIRVGNERYEIPDAVILGG